LEAVAFKAMIIKPWYADIQNLLVMTTDWDKIETNTSAAGTTQYGIRKKDR